MVAHVINNLDKYELTDEVIPDVVILHHVNPLGSFPDRNENYKAYNKIGFVAAIGSSVDSGGRTVESGGRVEAELGYRQNDFDELKGFGFGNVDIDGDISALSLMGNIYYDFTTDGGFYPFIGVGLGFANVEADIDNGGSEDETELAYQVILGGSFTTSAGFSIDLQYRYFGVDDPEFDGLEVEYRTHNLMIGLRQSF